MLKNSGLSYPLGLITFFLKKRWSEDHACKASKIGALAVFANFLKKLLDIRSSNDRIITEPDHLLLDLTK